MNHAVAKVEKDAQRKIELLVFLIRESEEERLKSERGSRLI